jgi:FkbM family methyltransferase
MLGVAGFASQIPQKLKFSGYTLLVPSGHLLIAFSDPKSPSFQPYRETGLVKIIRALQALKRSGTVIDIGANIGDTCAIIYRNSSLKILCIEASNFFFHYLTENIETLFKDRAIAQHAYIIGSPNEVPRGLFHWGGTAKAVDHRFTEDCEVLTISSLLSSVTDVALLKIDIDGSDIGVVSGAINRDETNRKHPSEFPIYFELEFVGNTLEQVRQNCSQALMFFQNAAAAGYQTAFMWDDPERFFGLFDLRNSGGMINALNYMGHFAHRSVWGFDVCLVHKNDQALFSELCRIISIDTVVPLRPN